jgi:alpha/beta superfamily hydrolase
MRQSAVSFEASGLTIEGVVAVPENITAPVPGVVICHPGPLNGGNMDNNVVIAVSFALVEAGFATIRFNFRGVGNSQGEHAKGDLEHEEALVAMDLLRNWPGVDGNRMGLAGYSFGTGIILGSADLQAEASVYALVSPGIARLENSPLQATEHPVFIISGDKDRLIEASNLDDVLKSFDRPVTMEFVPGVDHFWVGREPGLGERVAEFFTEHLANVPVRSAGDS